MAVSYSINALQSFIHLRFERTVRDDDLLRCMQEIVALPEYRRVLNVLWDFRLVEKMEMTSDGISAVVELERRTQPLERKERRAIVAPDDEVFGVARMYQLFADDLPQLIEVFRDIKPASEWLGVEVTGSDPV